MLHGLDSVQEAVGASLSLAFLCRSVPWSCARICSWTEKKKRWGHSQQPHLFSLRSCRSSSVKFFFDFSQGNLENLVGNWREFCGIFMTHRTKAQKFRGNFRIIFRNKIRSSKNIFRAKFTLQTCHLNHLRAIYTNPSRTSQMPFRFCDFLRRRAAVCTAGWTSGATSEKFRGF